jgi:carbonic anhydrase/acetyltransferase-like protein (isoleucine patch superfamily)
MELLDIIVNDIHVPKEEIVFIDDVVEDDYVANFKKYSYQEFKSCFQTSEIEIVIANGEPCYRKIIRERVENDGYCLKSIISTKAFIGMNCKVGDGVIVFPFSYIGNNSKISDNVIIHGGARIQANCQIGLDTFVSSGAFLGDSCECEKEVFVGPNSAVMDSIVLKRNTIAGMGSVVIQGTDEYGVYVGNPARFIRKGNGVIWRKDKE